MLIKITLALIILLLNAGIANAQFEVIEKKAERILISLSEGKSVDLSSLTELNDLLLPAAEKDLAEYSSKVNKHNIDSLKNCLNEFESELRNISSDSALFLFNQWYLKLNNTFYDYTVNKFFSSPKIKVLFLSTSMSCYCTLEMCKNQLIDILKLVKSSKGEYDYLAIDAYEKDHLPIKYEMLFTPSVLVFNGNNEVIHKIEYDEEMIIKLTNFLTAKPN